MAIQLAVPTNGNILIYAGRSDTPAAACWKVLLNMASTTANHSRVRPFRAVYCAEKRAGFASIPQGQHFRHRHPRQRRPGGGPVQWLFSARLHLHPHMTRMVEIGRPAAVPGSHILRHWYSTANGTNGTDGKQSKGSERLEEPKGSASAEEEPSLWRKMVESACTSLASIAMLGLGFALAGYAYHRLYRHMVLQKMTLAFEPGDPVLELAAVGRGIPSHLAQVPVSRDGMEGDRQIWDGNKYGGDSDSSYESEHGFESYWIERPEQEAINAIVQGRAVGHYHLLLGDKGTGKSSMLLEAMAAIDGEGVSMFDAHADLEIVRIRLGKALNYEFNEDYIGGYFSERGPRESTALLDIERALNKLERVALRRRNAYGRHKPLVLIINQLHLLRDDEDGRDLLELLQQRAEQWAAAGLVTMVFNSDDYWVYERLKQLAARLEVHSIQDLSLEQATSTLKRYRRSYFGQHVSDALAARVYSHVGGRLTFLNRVARSRDMLETCAQIIETEKTWLLNQCWILGADMDDDVMDQQKWAAAAMVLGQALVDKEAAKREAAVEKAKETAKGGSPEQDDISTAAVLARYTPCLDTLPSFALHEAQQIMTRSDFVRELDRRNLFTITSRSRVRAASVPMQEALRQICAQPGFRQHLEDTIQRISDIESLGRTRELVAKDLVLGGRYEVATSPVRQKGGVSKWLGGGGGGSSSSSSAKYNNKTEIRFRGWSPHERPPSPESESKAEPDSK